jgi:hypothetical protein
VLNVVAVAVAVAVAAAVAMVFAQIDVHDNEIGVVFEGQEVLRVDDTDNISPFGSVGFVSSETEFKIDNILVSVTGPGLCNYLLLVLAFCWCWLFVVVVDGVVLLLVSCSRLSSDLD